MHTLDRGAGDIWKRSKKDNLGTEFGPTWPKTGLQMGNLRKLVNELSLIPITVQESKLGG